MFSHIRTVITNDVKNSITSIVSAVQMMSCFHIRGYVQTVLTVVNRVKANNV